MGFKHKIPNYFLEVVAINTIVSRLISPFLDTESRIVSSGLGELSGGVDDTSFDLSERIDYIFISLSFTFLEAWYISGPQSDHPALWAEIEF